MHAVVLYHLPWELTRDLATTVATELGARCIPFDQRPDLHGYDLVVLSTPAAGVLDPRLFAFAATELRGRTLALLTDVGPLGEPIFWGLAAAVLAGGGKFFAPPLHISTGWLADTRDLARRQAQEWGKLLAGAFPTRSFPHGPAGKREYR
ncbi:MAG: hypothetical protein JWM80_5524 [Cyanobacteria bacterium RYN_339]|nr:hypothetical protein [Cyanobacteria bacterium RYN_339]